MAFLSWGKCLILVKDLEDASATWLKLPDQVEGSTQLNPTQGDKTEATVEGGETEDTRYGANKYELATQVRIAKGRLQTIPDVNGKVAHKYAVVVIPEDPAAVGLIIQKASVSVLDGFNAGDGGNLQYTFSANKPDTKDTNGNDNELVGWGYVTLGTKSADADHGTDAYASVTVIDMNDSSNTLYTDVVTPGGGGA